MGELSDQYAVRNDISWRWDEVVSLDAKPTRINRSISVETCERTYKPKPRGSRLDWVKGVACPALAAYQRGAAQNAPVRNFASIGTGSGIDALAAIEILGPELVSVSDVHDDVARAAANTVQRNVRDGSSVSIDSRVGSLLEPYYGSGIKFDLIYENLPNIPIRPGIPFELGENSATFTGQANDRATPHMVRQALLGLHFQFLVAAREYLSEHGSALCSIGGRIPLQTIAEMISSAGYDANLLVYTWKVQTEPEAVIDGYEQYESIGYGPFHYYPIDLLEKAFLDYGPEASVEHTSDIDEFLKKKELDVGTAARMVRAGEPIGHTVAVYRAIPRS